MEWALNSPTPESVAALRREVMAYLRRHAEADSDLAGAEVVVAELLLNAFQHAPGPAWVRIGWSGERPRLEVHDLGEGFVLDALPEPSAERGRGLFLVNALADDLDVAAKRGGGRRRPRRSPCAAASPPTRTLRDGRTLRRRWLTRRTRTGCSAGRRSCAR